MKKGLIVSSGEYPIGSMSNVTRLWVKGFRKYSISTELLITYPPPTNINFNNSESFVRFSHKPNDSKGTKGDSIFYIIQGIFKSYTYLSKRKKNMCSS